MSADDETIFICSFCEQSMKVAREHVGRRATCPKCQRKVFIYPNRNSKIEHLLSCEWKYRRPRLLLPPEVVGPISDEQFLSAVRDGSIDTETEICSPEVTKGEWI